MICKSCGKEYTYLDADSTNEYMLALERDESASLRRELQAIGYCCKSCWKTSQEYKDDFLTLFDCCCELDDSQRGGLFRFLDDASLFEIAEVVNDVRRRFYMSDRIDGYTVFEWIEMAKKLQQVAEVATKVRDVYLEYGFDQRLVEVLEDLENVLTT